MSCVKIFVKKGRGIHILFSLLDYWDYRQQIINPIIIK